MAGKGWFEDLDDDDTKEDEGSKGGKTSVKGRKGGKSKSSDKNEDE